MHGPRFRPGDRVVYRKQKTSASPGPRARETAPAPKGEYYHYIVDKYWVVNDVRDGQVELCTRRGKHHLVAADDPRLRKARWWERLLYARRYRAIRNEPASEPATGPEKPVSL